MTSQGSDQSMSPRPSTVRSASASHRVNKPPPREADVVETWAMGISFLSEADQPCESVELDEWQRYVHDRMRHFTISHR